MDRDVSVPGGGARAARPISLHISPATSDPERLVVISRAEHVR